MELLTLGAHGPMPSGEIHVLDCGSLQSAVDSFARILGSTPDEIRRLAKRVIVRYEGSTVAPGRQVAIQMGIDLGQPPTGYQVRWFHATRVPPTESFSEGLLPTPLALPKIWSALGTLAARWLTDPEWVAYQQSFLGDNDRHYSQQFRIKEMAERWEGPFAFLNRAAAMGQHGRAHRRFTAISETADDICNDFMDVFGHDLKAAYEKYAQPCLVVFVWPEPSLPALIAAANFIFHEVTGLDCGSDCNAVFRGDNAHIPAHMIESVDWLAPDEQQI